MVMLLLSRTPKLNMVLIVVLALFQSTQMMYFQYFGGFYSAFDMVLMLDETHDAVIVFIDTLKYMIVPFLLSTFFASIAFAVYKKTQDKIFTLPFVSVLMVLVFSFPFLQSLKSDASQKFQPNIAHSSIKNGLYSNSFFYARQIKVLLGLRKDMPSYESYYIEKIDPVNANVVMLMGEFVWV